MSSNQVNIQHFQESLKNASIEDLLAIIAAATAEAKKKAKVAVKESAKEKAPKEKKGSMPKGVLPVQLQESFAYVDYTLAQANKNGWKEFTVKGQDEAEEASEERNGVHVFPSTGKALNRKQAMSLSKFLWSNKEQKGADQAFYEAFKAQYVAPVAVPVVAEAVEVAAPMAASSPKKEAKVPKVKKTDEEKAAEKEAKKAAKKVASPAAPAAAAAPAAVAPKKVAPKKVAKKEEPKEEKDDFTCEDDGAAYPWDFKGKKFLRNFANQMWERTDDGEAGDWAGVFDPKSMTIDTSAEEPVFYEDEQ
jgi:hypothetical protein